jgi:flagellar FlgN protein
VATALREVSDVLWRERRLLELLEFKLEEERLLTEAGRVRWLARATREVAAVRAELRQAELARAVVVQDAAAELGLEPSVTLQTLAGAAPEPWDGVLARHRHALLRSAREVIRLADQCGRAVEAYS